MWFIKRKLNFAQIRPLWWANPVLFLGLVILPGAIAVSLVASSVVSTNRHGYRVSNFISEEYLLMFIGGIILLVIASWAGTQLKLPKRTLIIDPRGLDFLFWTTTMAYLIWYMPTIFRNPGLILGALMAEPGAAFAVKEANMNVAGITTMTQFGVAYAAFYSVSRFILIRPMDRRFDVYMVLLLGFALFRAIVSSERVAVLELIFPLVLAYGGTISRRANPLIAFAFRWFPLLTIFAAPIFFGLFEYNRSWIAHYQYYFSNIFEFSLERLAMYYVTALNNCSGLMEITGWPTYGGEFTLDWMYEAPVLQDLMPMRAPENMYIYDGFLEQYASLEFNNATGVLTVFHDWGIPVAVLVFIAMGLLYGTSYASFAARRGTLLYLYPILFYGIYETLRIGYLFDARFIAALAGLVACAVFGGKWVPAEQVNPTLLKHKRSARAYTSPTHVPGV